MSNAAKIREKYIDYVLENGRKPASIFAFCKSIKLKEANFYEHYSSFEDLEQALFAQIWNDTHTALQADKAYQNYSYREKVLSLFFTYFEQLGQIRSFILLQKDHKQIVQHFKNLQQLRNAVIETFKTILNEAKAFGEVADRKFVSSQNHEILWLNLILVFEFWMRDSSPKFEKTDACIEKSVNMSFDLMGENIVDKLFDFGKFMLSSLKK